VRVANTGERDGDEVVQLYLRRAGDRLSRPVQELIGFHRLPLAPGASVTLTFDVPWGLLAVHDGPSRYVLPAGNAELCVAASSVDIRATASVQIPEQGPWPHRDVFLSTADTTP
jgi:beta-glucosidase